MRLAYLYSIKNGHYFFRNLYKHFNKIKVQNIYVGRSGWFDFEWMLNRFDLYHIGYGHSFASDQMFWHKHIHPKYLINGRIISTSKTFVAEKFEEIFGRRLMIYAKDTQNYEGKVFRKPEVQTFGNYSVSKEPIFDEKRINQRFVGTGNRVWGVFFFKDLLLYSYEFVSDSKTFTKLKNKKETILHSIEETNEIFGDVKDKLFQLAKACGVDAGRFDVVFDEAGASVIDINNAPGAEHLYVIDVNPKAQESNYFQYDKAKELMIQSAELVESYLLRETPEIIISRDDNLDMKEPLSVYSYADNSEGGE